MFSDVMVHKTQKTYSASWVLKYQNRWFKEEDLAFFRKLSSLKMISLVNFLHSIKFLKPLLISKNSTILRYQIINLYTINESYAVKMNISRSINAKNWVFSMSKCAKTYQFIMYWNPAFQNWDAVIPGYSHIICLRF